MEHVPSSSSASQSETSGLMKEMVQGLNPLNATMSTFANNQLITMALSPICENEKYFADVFEIIRMETAAKKQRLELDQEELNLRKLVRS